MITSETRLLTTHTGSLPRPPALAALHGRRSRRERVDADELRAAVEAATAEVVSSQLAAGVDIGNDGEQARESFFTYVQHRMTGFGGTSRRPLMADLVGHPDFMEPDLALERHTLFADRPLVEFLAWVELVIDAINGALDGIEPADVRLHVCWGNYEGPHTRDVPLDDIQSLLYQARVGALVIPLANCRHAHEVQCFERRPLPDDMVLVAGVIDTTSNYVEHPELVAERLVGITSAVGDPSRVIAGTDCGFDTSAGIGDVAPSVVWEKLRALRAGADLASTRLFPGN